MSNARNIADLGDGITGADLPAGSVLQVVSTTKTDTFTTTSASYTDVTGFSVSITPTSASSKILVSYQISLGNSGYLSYSRIVRDSTPIAIADAAGSRPLTTASTGWYVPTNVVYNSGPVCMDFLDSPSTTSEITYKVQIRTYDASHFAVVNRTYSDRDTSAYEPRMVSTITVMEIAG